MSATAIDVVTPAYPPAIPYLRNLVRSMQRFWEIPGRHLVLVADDHWAEMVDACKSMDSGARLGLEVVPESSMLPPRACRVSGWWGQQLRKMSAADVVDTPYYYCVDADTFLLRPTRAEEFLRPTAPVGALRAVLREIPMSFDNWYSVCWDILKSPWPGPAPAMLPTPMLFSAEAMHRVTDHVTRVHGECWKTYLGRPEVYSPRDGFAWTESALYLSGLRALKLYDEYHVPAPSKIVGCGVYFDHQYPAWSPEGAVATGAPFSLVQSSARIPAEDVWRRIEGLYR